MSVLHLITSKPYLLLEHADAYTDLLAQEIAYAAKTWRYRAWMGVLTLMLAGCAAVLAGVGLMLWAITPPAQIHALWLLWLTPLVPLTFALVCGQKLRNHVQNRVFSDLRLQIKEDLALLRNVTANA
jgi:hypothetical protein